jgi:Cu/Ag efflux pump CusA
VIGGLATSTALTLFVIPTVYSLMDDLAVRLRGRR